MRWIDNWIIKRQNKTLHSPLLSRRMKSKTEQYRNSNKDMSWKWDRPSKRSRHDDRTLIKNNIKWGFNKRLESCNFIINVGSAPMSKGDMRFRDNIARDNLLLQWKNKHYTKIIQDFDAVTLFRTYGIWGQNNNHKSFDICQNNITRSSMTTSLPYLKFKTTLLR